jgi:hypothetical protein
MQAILGALSAHDFINYLTVSTGRAISEYDRKIEEEKEDRAKESSEGPSHVEFPLSIMRCQPSSKQYCETTTMDLFRLFTQFFLPH